MKVLHPPTIMALLVLGTLSCCTSFSLNHPSLSVLKKSTFSPGKYNIATSSSSVSTSTSLRNANLASPRVSFPPVSFRPPLVTTKASSTSLEMSSCTSPSTAETNPTVTPTLTSPETLTTFQKTSTILVNLFPVWTVLFTAWGITTPSHFTWLTTAHFTRGLALLMLSMGITLTPQDFIRVAAQPNSVALQFSLCYVMMPVLAFALGKLFNLPPAFLAGLVLVGSTNGGQASNLCTYIAKGDVALSVLMTTATTIGAIFMTPALCKLIMGAVVPVDAKGIALSTMQVVLLPITAGMTLNKFAPSVVKTILPVAPLVGVLSTCFLVASAVSQVAGPIKSAGINLQLPVLLLHLFGGLAGYAVPRLAGYNEVEARTMAIETSMKSSAFGFLLAALHFGEKGVRVPAAVSVVWMAVTGSVLAVVWRFIPVKGEGKREE